MLDLLQTYQWEIFIFLEIASWLFLFVFLLLRYGLDKRSLSQLFLVLFLLFIVFEAVLAFINYKQTGEIETFQIVVFIFVIYACTFGIGDFKKLDRYIKLKVGKWRKIDLLTDKDKEIMEKQKDPKVIAKSYRRWWYGHAIVFVIANFTFWNLYGNNDVSFLTFMKDWSWFEEEGIENAPYKHEMIMNIVRLWLVIFVIDTIVSWSYTIFPEKKKGDK